MKKTFELIELFKSLREKGVNAVEIINNAIDELDKEKNIPIKS